MLGWRRGRAAYNRYRNTVPTAQGGTHETGFRNALLKGLRAWGEQRGNKRAGQVVAEDLLGCAAAKLSLFLRDPQFQGQTKERLASAEATKLVETAVGDRFDHFLAGDPTSADNLLTFVIERAEERVRRRELKDTARKSATRRLRLPGKLADCTIEDAEWTELFLVEGDSAGGSAKQARARATQAVLPLRGKILNVASASPEKLRQNQELKDLIEALGCGVGERFDRSKLRYGRVIIMTDADVASDQPNQVRQEQGHVLLWCIVMEYIRGITLDTLLQRNTKLSPGRVGRLLGQLCEVLQAAHAQGIVHRDLKPTNLMVVDPDTPYELIKVMDFGLAKLLDKGSHAKINGSVATGAEFAVGTPGYMCPEQARGDEMDHRGDLYSVGVILFELLTGCLPFAGRCTMDVLLAHATEEPPTFAEIGFTLGELPNVEGVVRGCLTKDPVDRPASARELAERYELALARDQAGLDDMAPEPPTAPTPAERSPGSPPFHQAQRQAGSEPGINQQPASGVHSQPAAAAETPLPALLGANTFDPHSIVHHLEAWMPEKIATYKLRGFVQDAGGEVIESVPGRIRVRVGIRGTAYAPTRGSSWFGLGRKSGLIEMELHLQRPDPSRDSFLRITVVMKPRSGTADADWRTRCTQVFCDLRAYLMGSNG